MNANRRKEIESLQLKLEALSGNADTLQTALEDIRDQLEAIKDEEQEYFDNMPESLQRGDKGNDAMTGIEHLEIAVASMEQTTSIIGEALEAIGNSISEMGDAL